MSLLEREKNAISDPDAKADNNSNNIARTNATTAPNDGAVTLISGTENAKKCVNADVYISKTQIF
jgi:hypothetical protein